MAHLVKHFRLVHDTAPFVLFPFYNPEVEECPVQRPTPRAVGFLRPWVVPLRPLSLPWPWSSFGPLHSRSGNQHHHAATPCGDRVDSRLQKPAETMTEADLAISKARLRAVSRRARLIPIQARSQSARWIGREHRTPRVDDPRVGRLKPRAVRAGWSGVASLLSGRPDRTSFSSRTQDDPARLPGARVRH